MGPELELAFDECITGHLLLVVVSRLPFEDLAAAALVSSRWKEACASQALWRARLSPTLVTACTSGGGQFSNAHGLRRLYWALHRTNLLLNPFLQRSEQLPNRVSYGEDSRGRGRTPWFSMEPWRWEGTAPEGVRPREGGSLLPPPPLPQYNEEGPVRHPVAVLTSPNNWSAIMQIVELPRELERRGVLRAAAASYLDSRPVLELSLWHCGHEHGHARCEVWLALDDSSADMSSWLAGGGRYTAVATTGVVPCTPGHWTRVLLRLQGYPAGCRRAVVILKGSGVSGLLSEDVGRWGAKFASPTLRLLPVDEAATS